MPYAYVLMNYAEAYDDVRGAYGVDDVVLPQSILDSITNMPAAEMEMADRLSVDFTALAGDSLTKARLACVYLTAANSVQAARTNILRVESDNKTLGQRFKDALAFDEDYFRKKADPLIDELEGGGAQSHPDILEFVRPTTNVVTGKPYAS